MIYDRLYWKNEYLTEKFTSKKLEPSKAKIKGGITYRNPAIRISSYNALSEDAILEKNKFLRFLQ